MRWLVSHYTISKAKKRSFSTSPFYLKVSLTTFSLPLFLLLCSEAGGKNEGKLKNNQMRIL